MATRADAHRPEFHREHAWKHPVRVAATGNVSIAALVAGAVIDGVTLVAGDRVLLTLQTAPAENGIYDVATIPGRSYDLDTGIEAWGCIVRVLAGTANAGKVFGNTNATLPTLGVTGLTFAEVGAGNPLTVKDEGTNLDTAVTSIDFTGPGVTATAAGHAISVAVPGGIQSVKDEGVALATAPTSLDFVGGGVVASGTGAAKTITIPGGSTAADTSVWKPVMANNPNIVTSDGSAVWTPLVTVEGEAIMAFVPL